jgi:hypothetical protein
VQHGLSLLEQNVRSRPSFELENPPRDRGNQRMQTPILMIRVLGLLRDSESWLVENVKAWTLVEFANIE